MAIAVLPRATAAAVINQAVARGTWAVAFVVLVLDLPGLLDVFSRRGLQDHLATPLIALLVMLCALAATALRPVSWLVALYVLIAAVCTVVYEAGILSADPHLATEATYLVNRPALAIVIIGTISSSTLVGVFWCVLGYTVSIGASLVAAQIVGQQFVPGVGPTLVFLLYVSLYGALALVHRTQRNRIPDFARAEARTRRLETERDLTRRTIAAVHDTVLNDLSFVINAPDALDDTARERLRTDVATLTSAEWLTQAGELAEVHRSEAFVRNRLAAVVSEMQWRGLTVHVSGNGSTALRSTMAAAAAGVDAARACLENVIAHSGVSVAQIVLSQDEGESTIMVIDEGKGFDLAAVPKDRLGLKVAVIQRIEAVGGYVRIWSSPGNGTSVLISVPVVAAPDGDEPRDLSTSARSGGEDNAVVKTMQPSSKTSFRNRTAQGIDPLSWFAGPLAPLAFAAIILVLGTLLVLRNYTGAAVIAVQLAAVVVCSSACLLAHVATRPRRPPLRWVVPALVLLISLCGCLLSGLNNGTGVQTGAQSVEQWWAPGSVSLAIASLAPYLPIRRLVTFGVAATVVLGGIGMMTFPEGSGVWSVSGVIVIVITTPLLGLAAASVFVLIVVRTVERLLSSQDGTDNGSDEHEPVSAEDAAQVAEKNALVRLTARISPFLTELAESGHITATDRAVAGQLARRLRDDLVSRANASWLDGLAAGRPMVVMDPENRADTMNAAQKTAMTGLITAILETPGSESKSILIELRGQENGATAVGVSMDLALPEGRRTMHLAPYYLSLKTAFDGLSWSEGRLMNMSFEAPPVDGSASKA